MQLFPEITENVVTKLGFVAQRAKRDKKAIFDHGSIVVVKSHL